MNDQTTALPLDNESRIDDIIGASVKIDWDEIIAADDRGDPEEMLGGVAFDSANRDLVLKGGPPHPGIARDSSTCKRTSSSGRDSGD